MRRGAKRSAQAFAGLALAIALALLVGMLVPRGTADVATGPGRHEIVLVANAIHTDIALPATPQVLERLRFLAEDGLPLDHPELGAILVGWGGREFYTRTPTWGDLTPGAAFASVTLDDSVLRFALAPVLPADLPGTRRLELSDAQLDALLSFVEETLQRDDTGRRMLVEGAAYSSFDLFYEAEGWFNIAVGCNVWTSAALARAGIATGLWTPLPQTLLASIRWHGG